MTAINYLFRHEVAEKVREEGREEGRIADRAEMTLNILQWRGIEVPDSVRERVRTCTDLDELELRAQRAVHATDAAQLFGEE
ncbi:hypothetical protein J8N05_06755 [Streptomyces sp. BH-SS-21]|uniref:Uncharacterized protein n=1 Tax=Streptomyces liliiviolaceus TaxID=2823109 RepID=A0A940XU57_9ACTN|nr:hypothetical protein [Streptomyces liliiviolaceus]